MAGHSKWANIQHRKGKQDARRGKLFTKLIREITVAARMGGGDTDTNPRLRTAIDNALGNNMPKDTVERAVRRGTGEEGVDQVEEIRYEGYAPGGIAVMVDCMTDNRNRTVAEVRHAFNKCGGNLGTDGSVAYLFTKTGVISYAAGIDEDRLMEVAMEAGADDIVSYSDASMDVLTNPDDFLDVKERLLSANMEPESAEITMRAAIDVSVDRDCAESIMKLFDMLDELDDVQKVYSNADIPDEVLAELA